MTCIVGLVEDGVVYLGADSAGSNPSQITTRLDKKIFRIGEMLFGCCGSFRMTQLLRHGLILPEHPDDLSIDDYMVLKFIEGARTVFEAGGYMRKFNESEWGGDFLVGYRGHLYHIESDFQVGESAALYDACGNGDDVALGVLYATAGMRPHQRIKLALEASEYHNVGVRAPFHILSVHQDERTPQVIKPSELPDSDEEDEKDGEKKEQEHKDGTPDGKQAA